MKKLLLGYGISNQSIAKYFKDNNIQFDIYDDINKQNINIYNYDLIIKSNGINNDHHLLKLGLKNKIKIVSDLYLYYKFYNQCKDSILVTGSNGKTTVVSILEKCIKKGKSIGNNGLPFFDYINQNYHYIIEASSFMLENCYKMHFKYNIITNLYCTHLEHHKTFSNYVKAKCHYLKYLKDDDYLIYNYDDLLVKKVCNTYHCKKVSFSTYNKKATLFIDNEFIYYQNEKVFSLKGLKLEGKHNYYNIMAALGVLLNNPNCKENAFQIISQFKTLDYRFQLIKKGKINIYNDSKSTNFNALNVSLNCFTNKRILLIVGGKKRNDDYAVLNNSLKIIEKVYCFGENGLDFYNYFQKQNIRCYLFLTLEDVIKNLDLSNIDTILFSPASTSFDLYKNFEERGEHFNYLIKKYYKKLFFNLEI